MASTQAVWGIDVGRCALKAIKLRSAADGKVEVLGHDYVAHESILSEPDANRQELISAALEKFLSRNDITKDQVVVSVPGQHTLARFTKLPPVAPKRIPDIVRYEADQQIPFDMDEVIWDYQIFEQEGVPDVEVGIFAMKRELLREHLLHFEQASIEPSVVQSCPLAVYNAAHFDGMLGDETTVVLDIGAENIDLVIATSGSLWTRTIPIGGNSFTEALVKSFKLSFAKAENLKKTAESSKYRRQIFQAMRPIFADMVQELQRSIGFYSSTHREAQIDQVIGYGNAFKLPGLQKYLQQNLGIAVKVPTSFQNSGPPAEGTLQDEFSSFAVAYGLAIQGLDMAKVSSNLLPTEIAKQAVWRRKRPAFAATAACVVLAGALIWFRWSTDMRAMGAGLQEIARVSVSEEEAPRIIDSGPPSSLGPWGRASSVEKAAKRLTKRLGTLSGQGQSERAETQSLIDTQETKGIVATILYAIHESIPARDEAFSTVNSQAEVLQAIADGRFPPRNQRKQVTVESINLQFEPDLNLLEIPESRIESGERISDDKSELPGFTIRIICRTPNEGGAGFVDEVFLKPLRENGRRAEKGFFFDRVYLIAGNKLRAGGAAPPMARGAFAAPGASVRSTAGAITADAKNFDAVTLESNQDDWEFELWVDAILEDYPEPELEDGEEEELQED
ncbi:MAG: type IV pilus assembly protein PilM [Planctomycetes bacterium]|nr:type IV pilus assembly protein PilM [Planctomycetota bacterium]